MTEQINLQQSRVLESIVLQQKDKVPFKKWMQPIRDAYPFGQLTFDDKYLLLTEADYEVIAELLKDLRGYDVHSAQQLSSNNRMEVAKRINNEKSGGAKAGNDWILISTLSGQLKLKDGDYRLPFNSILVMDLQQLKEHQHHTILMVENKAVLPHLSSSIFNGIENYDPLIIYRGDPYFSVATANEFIISQQEQCQIHTFFDSDPKGLSMALAVPSISGLWLVDLANISVLQNVNQEITFQQQSSVDYSIAQKCESFGAELTSYYHRMNQYRIAIMQEHVVARNLGIVLLQNSQTTRVSSSKPLM